MDKEIGFQMFKHITIQQNRELLKRIAKDFKLPEHKLVEKYLNSDYYLPIIKKDEK